MLLFITEDIKKMPLKSLQTVVHGHYIHSLGPRSLVMNNLDKKTAIQFEQLNQLYAVNFLPLVTSVILAAILAFVQRNVINPTVIVAWLSLITLIMVSRTLLILAYQRASTDIKAETHHWLLRFRLGILITGLTWGAAGVLLFPVDYPQNQMFLIFMLAGLTAGGVTSYASDIVSALSFSVLALTPCIIRLTLVGESFYLAMSLASTLYLGFLVMSLRYINRNISENIVLRLEATEREATLNRKAQELSNEISFRTQVETDLLKAKEIAEEAKEMAEEATRIKSEFLANMSHEIRTPMNGVLGMLDLLSETSMSQAQLDWVKTAHSSGQALLEIINDILDLTKLEADKLEVEHVDFNLVDLVEDVCILSSNRAFSKGLELNCQLPTGMPLRWRGDPMRIRQVLSNLISNAVKFTEQGEVTVSIIQSLAANNVDQLRFEIHDTGIGISESTLSRLFEPFVQADSATSRCFGGSGLGLSISKKLVELMGGTIGASSITGKGSCFWFSLPLTKSESDDPNISLPFNDLSDKRILIVDDNATNRNILNTYLSSWGLVVSEADSGSAALMHLQTSTLQGIVYDLILLDMQMPVMDGLTLAKCLTQIPALTHLPIILLSSDNQIEPADYQGTGIIQRLFKPLRQMQLYDAIFNALLGRKPSTVVNAEPETNLPNYQNKKVLIVEDNKINQKVIVAKLRKYNIVPDVAENGQLALDKLKQCRYDLIFMDCHMPVMDGYTATRELRLLESHQNLSHQTVIALTANALEGERDKCLAAGMDDYITKPIITSQLMTLLIDKLG